MSRTVAKCQNHQRSFHSEDKYTSAALNTEFTHPTLVTLQSSLNRNLFSSRPESVCRLLEFSCEGKFVLEKSVRNDSAEAHYAPFKAAGRPRPLCVCVCMRV